MRQAAELIRNEKVWRLAEVNLVRAPHHQRHRYQIIMVNRDGTLCEHWTDMGPSKNFTANEFVFPLMWEHSVEEALDMAEDKRNSDRWKRFLEEKAGESTLIQDAIKQVEERHRIINNRSSFGPGVSKQRNGFSKRAALEVMKRD